LLFVLQVAAISFSLIQVDSIRFNSIRFNSIQFNEIGFYWFMWEWNPLSTWAPNANVTETTVGIAIGTPPTIITSALFRTAQFAEPTPRNKTNPRPNKQTNQQTPLYFFFVTLSLSSHRMKFESNEVRTSTSSSISHKKNNQFYGDPNYNQENAIPTNPC
jgi:hypothetical protein